VDIVAPSSLNGSSIANAVGGSPNGRCEIDLRAATFVDPAGLVTVAAAVSERYGRVQRSRSAHRAMLAAATT